MQLSATTCPMRLCTCCAALYLKWRRSTTGSTAAASSLLGRVQTAVAK
jgi:hypothetical protein